MNGQVGQELIDFGDGASSPKITFEKKLSYDGVVFAHCTFQANPGGYVAFSKITAAVHDGSPIQMEWRPEERGRIRSSVVGRGSTMLVDADVPVWKRWAGPRSILAFAMSGSFVDQVWRDAFDGVGARTIQTAIGVEDPLVKHICDFGRRELVTGGVGGRLYIEGLATALTVHLLRTHGTSTRAPTPYKGGLTPIRLRRVLDFIAAHLGSEISLADLARVAELSTHHFGESFKTSTGQPPHRYVMDLRIERARDLLRNGDRSVAEIAFVVGFSSQAHLTANFRRVTGITPGRFRRSLG